jgi:hypothetical protein
MYININGREKIRVLKKLKGKDMLLGLVDLF